MHSNHAKSYGHHDFSISILWGSREICWELTMASNHINTKVAKNNWYCHNLLMYREVQITGNRMEKGKKSRLVERRRLTLKHCNEFIITDFNLRLLYSECCLLCLCYWGAFPIWTSDILISGNWWRIFAFINLNMLLSVSELKTNKQTNKQQYLEQ